MCCITEHVNTVSQSVHLPSSIWVLVDVRLAFCQFLSCFHWQDECITTDFSVSKQFFCQIISDLFKLYVWAYTGRKQQNHQSVHKHEFIKICS